MGFFCSSDLQIIVLAIIMPFGFGQLIFLLLFRSGDPISVAPPLFQIRIKIINNLQIDSLIMNFCRWASGSNCMDYPPQPQPQQNYVQVQSPPNFFQPNNSQKISVKGPEIVRERVQVRFCQPLIGCDQLNQTQLTNCGTYSQWGQQSMHTPSTFSMPKRKNSIIDGINDDSFKDLKQTNFRSTQVRQPGMYRSSFERQRLKSQQPFKRSEFSNYTEPANKSSYAQLLRENYELKRIINEEFLPLKSMYARLKQEQEDREYLVSQLEWKVKELAREIKNKRI